MPKRSQEDYEDDGGFVEDAPKSKKQKDRNDNGAAETTLNSGTQIDEDGNEYWELSRGRNTRRVGISSFKDNTLVNLREFYQKDDKWLPGKKGISLPIEQFEAFIGALPAIEAALHSRGISVSRPNYDGAGKPSAVLAKAVNLGEDGAAKEDGHDAQLAPGSKLDKFKFKANHEVTSEEDEG
ncbi:hypothetical protein BAUCODRAFT_498768 [Baudoinia panamericana UAMH 10762]|uniref:Transcriptional coactivator p15 (PC4) C-terminal domain-containing protein n=1 Tax=Baudoinia panamericana (strain UAMH 10762) TaxID=717646 RepID=M2LMW1_BAUPA|nr:uncharacterized protein BAUCODRAFT_498768 [Baudoinia panamericana UAMH 10762]EMC95672.1 hypothetical protein BAUCODRAFT_498768 [Baudoinia panamericana UAMH 10762]